MGGTGIYTCGLVLPAGHLSQQHLSLRGCFFSPLTMYHSEIPSLGWPCSLLCSTASKLHLCSSSGSLTFIRSLYSLIFPSSAPLCTSAVNTLLTVTCSHPMAKQWPLLRPPGPLPGADCPSPIFSCVGAPHVRQCRAVLLSLSPPFSPLSSSPQLKNPTVATICPSYWK